MNEPWRITLLGGLRVERGDQVITRFRLQKVGGLLGYLAFHLRQMHSREVLIDVFWPESAPEAGRNSLSVALSSLRHQLEPPGTPASSVIRADRFSIGLNPAGVTTDVLEFETAVRDAGKAGSPVELRQLLSRAVELYGGALLPGHYEEWIVQEQERLAGLFFDSAGRLVQALETAGDRDEAIRHARRAVTVDPLREDLQRHLVRLLAASGQPAEALRQYKELERALEEALGEEPSAATRAIARQIERETGIIPPAIAAPAAIVSPAPPAGPAPGGPDTLTFLMTDIEGSTRLWQSAGDRFKAALERHHALVREEVRRRRGLELKETGDSFLISFQSAGSGLACAAAIQQRIGGEPWPEGIETLRVRMALHTGDIEQDNGDFRSLLIHRLSRILTAGHGGQILVSEATAGLLHRDLQEENLRLVDLGLYRLKDLPVPERLFQVEYPQMAQFPPLAAEAGYAASLPVQFTRFFGRQEEIARVIELLEEQKLRLVTLMGPGGAGKTRLALEVAGRLVRSFGGAVWFVSLAEVSDAQLIPSLILEAMRLKPSPTLTPLAQVTEALKSRRALLVLDNFEHLVEDGAGIVRGLLAAAPELVCLVTFRLRLNLSGEREFPVPPLPTPNGGETLEQLTLLESVQLFIDRAQSAMPYFQITNHNAPAVAELCQRLEGIPLAIELAASRVGALTPLQMLAHLENRFQFHSTRQRDVSERHRTLRAAIDWSYQLLRPEVRRFFKRLSVFVGGWSAEAAEEVCEEPLALDYLAELRDASLVSAEDRWGSIHFWMLETLREYAQEQLSPEELALLYVRRTEYFVRKAEEDAGAVFGLMFNNVRAVLSWCEEHQAYDTGIRVLYPFSFLLWYSGHWNEGLDWCGRMLAGRERALEPRSLARCLTIVCRLKRAVGDLRGALAAGQDAAKIAAGVNDPGLEAHAMEELGIAAAACGEYELARRSAERSVQLFREHGLPYGALIDLGWVYWSIGDVKAAKDAWEEALAMPGGRPMAISNLAILAVREGDLPTALAFAEEVNRGKPAPHLVRHAQNRLILGWVQQAAGNLDSARATYRYALERFRDLDHFVHEADTIRMLGQLFVDGEQPATAARLMGAAHARLQEAGGVLDFFDQLDQKKYLELAREALGEESFNTEWHRGVGMSRQEAVDYTLAVAATPGEAPGSCPG